MHFWYRSVGLLFSLVTLTSPTALPGCFSADAPAELEGQWWPTADAPPAAKLFANAYKQAIRSPECARLLDSTKQSSRTCRAEQPPWDAHWWPTNCELSNRGYHATAGTFRSRSALLLGDSLIKQLGVAIQCFEVAHADLPALGLNVTVGELGHDGLLPGRGALPGGGGDGHVQHAALAAADAALINVGAHYNLDVLCGAARLALGDPACNASALLRASHGDAGGYSPSARKARGLNLRSDLEDDTRRFFGLRAGDAKDDDDDGGGGGGDDGSPSWLSGGRVLWRESLPQHYDGYGTYSDSLQLHKRATHCAPLDADGARVARWRNDVTTPLARRAGLRVLPAFELAVPRADSHPSLLAQHAQHACPTSADGSWVEDLEEHCDCTHFCYMSAAMAAHVALALGALASVYDAHPAAAMAEAAAPPPAAHRTPHDKTRHEKGQGKFLEPKARPHSGAVYAMNWS